MPSAPPAYIESAKPIWMCLNASKMASVPVLQAEEFVVVWPPSPRNLPTATDTELSMILGTMSVPIGRTPIPGSWSGAAASTGPSSSHIVSMPPMPQPMMAPVVQSTGVSL